MMLALTIVRALSMLGAPVALLVSVIVAFPTPALFDGAWFLVALGSAALYIGSTWAFVALANQFTKQQCSSQGGSE